MEVPERGTILANVANAGHTMLLSSQTARKCCSNWHHMAEDEEIVTGRLLMDRAEESQAAGGVDGAAADGGMLPRTEH